MKPICLGESKLLCSIKFTKRLSKIKLNNLAKAEPMARPLKLSGSLVSPFLKIGFRKFRVHLEGYIWLENILLTSLRRICSNVCPNIFKYSPIISSGPGAFPTFRLFRASCNSFKDILLSRIGLKVVYSSSIEGDWRSCR